MINERLNFSPMDRFDVIAFDLDGTLSDPSVGLVTGFCYGLSRMGVSYGEKQSLRRFIGPPLFEAWCSEFGFDREQCDRAISLFREYYTVYGWRENTVYPGIYEMLDRLIKAGKTLVVATSKPEEQARKIITLFGMDKYFAYVGGAISHHQRATKAEVLKYSLESAGVSDLSRVILVGDRSFDARGAAVLGIPSLGVLWGHGTEEELSSAGFERIVSTPHEAVDFLLS